jgi:hypothetical protein
MFMTMATLSAVSVFEKRGPLPKSEFETESGDPCFTKDTLHTLTEDGFEVFSHQNLNPPVTPVALAFDFAQDYVKYINDDCISIFMKRGDAWIPSLACKKESVTPTCATLLEGAPAAYDSRWYAAPPWLSKWLTSVYFRWSESIYTFFNTQFWVSTYFRGTNMAAYRLQTCSLIFYE